jgi:hypothetical protein
MAVQAKRFFGVCISSKRAGASFSTRNMSPLTGLVIKLVYHYKYASPTALEQLPLALQRYLGKPRQGRNLCRKNQQNNQSAVRGDIFRHWLS